LSKMVIVTLNTLPAEGIMGLTSDGKEIVVRRAEMYSDGVLDDEFVMLLIEKGFAEVFQIKL